MALVFHRGLAVPLWAIAFFAVALAAPPRPIPPVTVLVGIAVLALTMMAMVQWRRTSRALAEVRPRPMTGCDRAHPGIFMAAVRVGTGVRTFEVATNAPAPDDALELVRMDDDGGWQMARQPAVPLIPGAREPGMLTTFAPSAAGTRIPDEPSTMDATTIAERQREGGGAPSQRRPASERWWPDVERRVHHFVTATRALYARRLRSNHV